MISPRRALAVTLLVTCVTAWFSYGYFAIDEHFQVVEPTFYRLGLVPRWALPWEIHEQMRPWLQPLLYYVVGRGVGVFDSDPFVIAFAFRLVTGLACVAALALYLRTTLPWFTAGEERRLHLTVATLTGFLPYLFVRTSSETLSMAAATAAFAVLLEGAHAGEEGRWHVPALERPARLALSGVLFGVAFEARFHTAVIALGVIAWAWRVGRARPGPLALVALGGVVALGLGALADRWGYGEWTFPAWTYFRANVLEGAAGYFGSDPPLAYLWILPANVFLPVVAALLVLAAFAWLRAARHPLTWATLPFFAMHNLVAHKEERFVFPIAILATGLVTLGLRSWPWAWRRRRGKIAKALAVASLTPMILLALYPLGWNHHVRFQRHLGELVGEELHAHALPEFELGLPAYHPRVYDVEKSEAAAVARLIDEGRARPWLVLDAPSLPPELSGKATLVWSELPLWDHPALAGRLLSLVEAYNQRAKAPLRRLEYRSLYRIDGRIDATIDESASVPPRE